MISVLLDTNVLLDSMLLARPQHKEARRLVELVASRQCKAFVSAGSLKDIYYVTRKHVDEETMRGFIRVFLELFDVCPVDGAACKVAVDSNEPDFEDGIIRAIAEAEHVDFIVTRDEYAYTRSAVKKLDTSALLKLIDPSKSNTR